MNSMLLSRTLCVLLLAVLTGCNIPPSKEFIDPVGPDAEPCLQFCSVQRIQCRDPIEERREICKARYEIANRQYEHCLNLRPRRICSRPFPCPAANFSVCSDQYEKCFLGCGGRIRYPDDPLSGLQ